MTRLRSKRPKPHPIPPKIRKALAAALSDYEMRWFESRPFDVLFFLADVEGLGCPDMVVLQNGINSAGNTPGTTARCLYKRRRREGT